MVADPRGELPRAWLTVEDSGIATITLGRAPLNVYDTVMRDALIEILHALHDLPDVRVVVLRAEGRHFSAGADLAEFGSADFPLEARRLRWDRDPWTPLWTLPVPVVVALHGFALGAGLEMALLCDIRVAAHDTVVGLPETVLGMLPSAGGTQTLSKTVGPDAALPPVLLSTRIPAQEAWRRGLVHAVVPDADAAAEDIARELARRDPAVLRALKRQLREAVDEPCNASPGWRDR